MRNIFFMPLRQGSKGIPEKNHKTLLGKPLFSWVLEGVINSNAASEIWVATDCKTVKNILINEYPSVKIFNRKSENAQDDSPTIDVVLEFLSVMPFNKKDYFILFQATSPFTSTNDFLKLIHKMESGKSDSYIACARLKRFRWSDDGVSLDYQLNKKPRRQDYKGFLVETGAFYASKVGAIISNKKLISGKIEIVELSSEALIDIDEPIDWYLGEAALRYLQSNGTY